jgi:hypothetical protein
MERKQNIEEIFENAKEPHPNNFNSGLCVEGYKKNQDLS